MSSLALSSFCSAKYCVTVGIELASNLGLDGVQIYATTGGFSQNLSKAEKEQYKKLLQEKGLQVSALRPYKTLVFLEFFS